MEADHASAVFELEAALLRQPNVTACAVLAKRGPQGEQRIAYVVPNGAFSAKTVENRMLDGAPDLALPDGYVLVSALPLDDQGMLDEAALLRLPLLELELAERVEQELLADPRIEHAAVFIEERPRRPGALHVSDLLPDEALGGTASAGAAARAERAVPDPVPEATAAAPADEAPLPLAVRQGAPLGRPAGGPETLLDALRIAAERADGRGITYLADDGSTREQSMPELLAEARRIASALQSRGMKPGQRVLLQLAAADDVLPAFWGCLLGGFVPAITPIPPSYEAGTNELERLCQVWQLLDGPPLLLREQLRPALAPLEARLGIDAARLAILDELRKAPDHYQAPDVKPEDVAFLVFTSGSTGAPKIIMLSHRNILTRSQGTNELCRHETSDRILNWLPFDHIGSISDWHLRCVDLGCHMVYCSKEYVLGDPINWLRLIQRFRITHSWAPNFAYALVNDALNRKEESFELASMKTLLTAGEAVSSNTVHEFLRRLAPHGLVRTALRPAFGMAELGSGVTYYLPTEQDPVRVEHVDRGHLEGRLQRRAPDHPNAIGFTSCGTVIPGAGMRIVDETNTPLPELTIGRLQICGGPVTQGYFRNPEANREVFVGEGWFNTGDRGFIANGELYLTGRDKESLIINGANYSNSEIESVVEEVPGLSVSFTAACAVRPTGDPEERLAIFFSPAPDAGIELSELLRKVQASVTRKTGVKPDFLLPVAPDVIPKTAIGKIQRKQLVKRFESGDFGALLKQVDVLLENDKTISNWFLAPRWRKKALRPGARSQPKQVRLIADATELADALRAELERRGVPVVSSGTYTDVVDLRGHVPDGQGNGSSAVQATRSSTAATARIFDLFERIQQAQRETEGARSSGARLRYWVVGSQSQAVTATDAIDPLGVVVPPAICALSHDLASVECRHLDLDPSELARSASAIADEIEALSAEHEVAFRGGARWVPCFERVTFPALAERASTLARGGFYALTGGLGGVGSELARYLLTAWGASLVIVGRTPLDGAPEHKRVLYTELQALGPVHYRALDIGDAAALERTVAELEAELGKPLAGAFHLASVYHERPATDETPASFAAVLAPKMDGAIALHALLEQRPQAFVVCFSSVVSVFSAGGFSAYSAANRFLDAYCHDRRHRRGQKSYSIDWSVWDGLGIAAESAAREILQRLGPGAADGTISAADVSARMIEAERSRGYLRMPVLSGMRSLTAALGLPPGQLLAGVDLNHPNLRSLTVGDAEPLLGIRGGYTLRAGTDASALGVHSARDRFGQSVPSELRRLSSAPLTAEGRLDRDAVLGEIRGASRQIVPPQTDAQKELAEIWKEVLDLESVGINESFFDLGGTSLLSVRMFAEVERRLGVSLQLATLFQAATIQALAELIEAKSGTESKDALEMLAPASGAAALFLIHDSDGNVERYRALAQHLAPDVRVYGLAPYAKDRFPALHTRLRDMVDYHVAKIRTSKVAGPYLVGGTDAGGVLAFEVACRLQSEGERVGLVLLLDTTDVGLEDGRFFAVRAALSKHGTAFRPVFNALLKTGFDHTRVRLLDRLFSRGAALPWYLEHIPPRVVYAFASAGHRPQSFRGRLTLFRAKAGVPDAEYDDRPALERCGDPLLGWGARASEGVEIVDVPGGHYTLLTEPHVADLAAKAAAAIRAALRSETGSAPGELKSSPQPSAASLAGATSSP